MNKTIKGKTASGILKTAEIIQTRAGLWCISVSHPHPCQALMGESDSYWGGDALVLIDSSGMVAKLEMTPAAARKLAALEQQCESKYASQF